jgi:glycine/D-amino acid oxidase-like deaminating enzyme/nitrite reductase/ring-hydroxylating ferredoxin subunit
MNQTGHHDSLWTATAPGRAFPALDRDLWVDVAVVGGGITGLTAAFALQRAGLKVAVLDQGRLAAGASGYTTAHLTMAFDTGLDQLRRAVGDDGARAVWQAGRLAIDHIEKTASAEGISCQFRRVPAYYFASRGRDAQTVEDEAAHARALGFVADIARRPGPYPPMRHTVMRLANQAEFHPRRYLLGLADRFVAAGGVICEDSHVSAFHPGVPARVEANGFAVTASHVVFATHVPIHNRLFVSKLAAYQSYVVAARVPSGTFPHALAWDSEEPYHYWRVAPGDGHDLVIVGGEDHRTGQDDHACGAFDRLEAYVAEQLMGVEHAIVHRWSAQWWEPVDGLPFIGRLGGTPNQYVATGFSGNGMTMGAFAGLMIADLIQGKPHPMERWFAPSRLNVRAGAVTFLTENTAYPAYMLRDWLTPAETAALEELRTGEGMVVSLNGRRVAASKDDNGELRLVSAVCTHMGCQVHWNEAEVSWDCPCHGSRFAPDGSVMSGPAIQPLAPVEAPRMERAED